MYRVLAICALALSAFTFTPKAQAQPMVCVDGVAMAALGPSNIPANRAYWHCQETYQYSWQYNWGAPAWVDAINTNYTSAFAHEYHCNASHADLQPSLQQDPADGQYKYAQVTRTANVSVSLQMYTAYGAQWVTHTYPVTCTGPMPSGGPPPTIVWVIVNWPSYPYYSFCNLSYASGGFCGPDYFPPTW